MRSFIISVVLLFLVTSAVTINSFYARGIYDELLGRLDVFPQTVTEGVSENVKKTSDYLEGKKHYLYFTLPQNLMNDLFCDYSDTVSYLAAGDEYGYAASLEKTKLRLKLIQKNEEFSLYELLFGKEESKKRYFP